jgi:response regulator RpfG family c-di-GMP phosphodiesterase
MSRLAPHLFLCANTGSSQVATLLDTAGYTISRVNSDAIGERISRARGVDGVVVDLPAFAAIAMVRRIQAHRRSAIIVVISPEADTVRRALPSAHVVHPEEMADDLISTVDLALVAYQLKSSGQKNAHCAAVATG